MIRIEHKGINNFAMSMRVVNVDEKGSRVVMHIPGLSFFPPEDRHPVPERRINDLQCPSRAILSDPRVPVFLYALRRLQLHADHCRQ